MVTAFIVPRFKDGDNLSEQKLYALARLSIEFFRWNCIAGKNFGFFAPSTVDFISNSSLWNQFNWEDGSLSVSNLFVISVQGYPFIVQGQTRIEKVGKTLKFTDYLHFCSDFCFSNLHFHMESNLIISMIIK